jgi:hypothetical protein
LFSPLTMENVPLEIQLKTWKSRCVHAEKELKAVTASLDTCTTNLLITESNCAMWQERAIVAEYKLREMNQ